MLKLPIPDLILNNIYELKPEALRDMGVTLLLMDLDNTLDKYHALAPGIALRNWIDALKKAAVEPFIYSNSHGRRAGRFAGALGVAYINRAGKPDSKRLAALLRAKGAAPENTAIIGDQIYTDILCGKRAGIKAIAVRPIDLSNPFRRLRYGAELPFRLAYKRRANIKEKKA
ncbi:MAG: HAD hydrolase-like protein [Oscillospiraceae bacterium]|jgi:HAD superfamily phosphatase (TIGR01668 family)|nr:HAD hydrolase-like protein [Oscillospiraceae bacterium]